jgi:hypothetical protein
VSFAEARQASAVETVVDIRYSILALRVLDASGKVVSAKPTSGPFDGQMLLRRVDDSWSVAGFRNVSAS